MKILNKLTIKNIKLNKKRTIVTIIGIILSVALICAVGGMFTSARETLMQGVVNDTGYFHINLKTDRDGLNKLSKNRDIKYSMNLYEIGYSLLENSANEYKPYLKLLSIENPNDFLNLNFKLIDGRYPANQDEVVISDTIKTNGKVEYKIGDMIELNLGKRYACGKVVETPNYLPNELRYDYLENTICDSENIEVENTRKIKIVGIIERPNYFIENYEEAGYSLITTNLKSNSIISNLVLKDVYDYENSYNELKSSSDFQEIKLNQSLLNWEIFAFNDGTTNMLMSICLVVITIIMITSIFCIRNSFAISTLEKTKMFGMLASVGATRKQIKYSVLKEGFIIGLIGIPLGILSGILADYILILIMNKLTEGIVLDTNFVFKISIYPILISIILGIVTIYLSAITSSRRASKISPLEAIRNTSDIKISNKKLKTPRYIKKFFKTGGVIAYKNLKRSKKKYRTTVISLVVSILTFITMNSFINYAFSLSGVYYTDYKYDLIVYPKEEEEINKILSLDGIANRTLVYSTDIFSVTDLSKVTNFGYDCIYEDNGTYECFDRNFFNISIKVLDDSSFERFVNDNNLNYDKVKNKGILMDYYLDYTTDGMINKRVYNYKINDQIKGTINDEGHNFVVGGIVKNNPIGMENLSSSSGYLFLNQKYFNNLDLRINYIAINTNDSNKLEEDILKLNLGISMDNISKRKQEEKSMIILYSIFLYGFITVITLIGVTNIFNTITANMNLRQKEFMILKSIGMTKKEFNRMINLETFFYSFKALFYGIILGILGSYFVYKAFATNYDSGFSLPYKAILISIICVTLLVFLIMKYSINKINKQNIIETIRKENI